MVLKPCGHSSAEVDPHPYCDECAFDKTVNPKGRLCTPTRLCEHCRESTSLVWKLIDKYRSNKRRRRERVAEKRQDAIKEICADASISRAKALEAVTTVINSAEVTENTSTVDYKSVAEDADRQLFDFLNTTPEGSDFSFPGMGEKKVKKASSSATTASKKAALAKRHEALRAQMEKELAEADGPEDVPVTTTAKTSSRASSTVSVKPKRRPDLSPITKDKKQKRSRSRQRTPTKRSSNTKPSRNRSDSDRREKRRSSRERRSQSSKRRPTKRRSLSRSVSRHRQDKYARRDSRSRSRSRKRDSFRERRSCSSQRSARSYTGLISQRRKAEEREERREQEDSYRDDRHRSRSPRTRKVDRRSHSRDRQRRHQRASYSPGEVFRQAKQMFESFREKQLIEEGDADDSDDEELVEPSNAKFPFKEVIDVMATHSDVELKEGASYTSRGFQMASDDPSTNVKKEFKALTTSLGLVEAAKLWQEDFARRDAKKEKVKRGKFIKCNKLRSSLRAYKSGDDWLTMDPLYHEKQNYAWMAQPSEKIPVSQADIIYMEGQMRSILRVVNFQEVINQTVNAGLAQPFDVDIMLKLHKCNKQATRDLIKLSTGMFCGLAQLRKDDILLRSPKIPVKLEFKLRHSELADVQNMFPEELLVEVDGVYTQQLSTTVMERYTGRGRGGSHAGKQTQKRGYSGYQSGYQQGGYNQDQSQREFKRGRGRGHQGGAR